MAELVGMPCALATELVLSGALPGRGVIRPIAKEVYEPLLAGLQSHGISFIDTEKRI